MSIQSEINRIKAAAAAIAASISRKGVTVPDGTKLDGMAALVDSIQSGGGSGGDDFEIVDASYLFNYGAREDIIDKLLPHVKRPTNMSYMFNGCKNITELDVSGIDTSGVTDMDSLFSGCKALTSIDVSKFDTSNVTIMGSMFQACRALASIDVSKFDTSNVTSMSYMFQSMQAVKVIDVSNFDTAKVSNMSGIFDYCSELEEILGFSACYGSGMQIDFPRGSRYGATYHLRRLTFRTDLPDGQYAIRSAINIGYCSFERSGIIEMFGTLPDISSIGLSASFKKITITKNPCVTGKLADGTACDTITDADRAIATTKGWTLVE